MSLLSSNSVKLQLYVELRYMKSDRTTQKLSKDSVNLWEPWNCEHEPTKSSCKSNEIQLDQISCRYINF